MKKLKYLLMACCAACVWLAACSDDDYEPLPDWWWEQTGEPAVYPEPEPVDNKVVAHRGCYAETGFPQNSVAGLKKAVEMKLFASECDIHLTKDGKVVVYHDDYYLGNTCFKDATYAELCAKGTLANGEKLPLLEEFIDVVLEAGTTRLWLDVKNITIDGKSTEEGREASARACERACEIIEEMGAQNFCEFIVTGNATKISSSSPVTIWQRSLAAAGAVGSNAGWMSFRNPADYISYGYPWANLSTENLYFEGKTVNKNGYSVQKFLDAGLKLSVYNADLDVDMDYYLAYKDKLYAICTNYPRKLLGKWN